MENNKGREYIIFYKYIRHEHGHMGFSGKSYDGIGHTVEILTPQDLRNLNQVEKLIKESLYGDVRQLKITGIMEMPS
jgi:hypothetical protein